MSNTAENFSAAARDPNPSFRHWSTYLTAESKEEILQIIHKNLPELLECRDFGPAAKLPTTLTNDYMARLFCVLAHKTDLPILDRILEAGIPIDIRDKDGTSGLTALQIRAKYLNLDAMAALLERGADPEIRDGDGRSALDHVVTAGTLSTRTHPNFLRSLMHKGSQESDTVREAIHVLAQHGADLYAQDVYGHTAFAKAILAVKPDAVKAFLDMADAGEFDLLGRKVSGNLTAKQFCHGYSEGIAKGEVSGTNDLFQICYHTDVEIDILQHEADCKKLRQEIRAQMEAGTYVPPFSDNELL
jgi:ankyrin repeat protein